jgi:hypothetical protein
LMAHRALQGLKEPAEASLVVFLGGVRWLGALLWGCASRLL